MYCPNCGTKDEFGFGECFDIRELTEKEDELVLYPMIAQELQCHSCGFSFLNWIEIKYEGERTNTQHN